MWTTPAHGVSNAFSAWQKQFAFIGDLIKVAVRDAQPGGMVKKAKCVLLSSFAQLSDSPPGRLCAAFWNQRCCLIDEKFNPLGIRIFGPVARELREKNFAKIISLAPGNLNMATKCSIKE